jgi:hypothetical protein
MKIPSPNLITSKRQRTYYYLLILTQNSPLITSKNGSVDERQTGIDERRVGIDERHFKEFLIAAQKAPPQYFGHFLR